MHSSPDIPVWSARDFITRVGVAKIEAQANEVIILNPWHSFIEQHAMVSAILWLSTVAQAENFMGDMGPRIKGRTPPITPKLCVMEEPNVFLRHQQIVSATDDIYNRGK